MTRNGKTPPPAAAPEPLRIYVGPQWDGCVYALDPLSRERIKAAHPEARVASQVSVGYGRNASFEETQGPVLDQIAALLTGLTREQLQALGGVAIYDPKTNQPLTIAALAS